MPKTKRSREEYAFIREKTLELRRKGVPYRKIATYFGVSSSTIRSYVEGEEDNDKKRQPLRRERYGAVRSLFKAGKTRNEIACILGLSRCTVNKYLLEAKRGVEYKVSEVHAGAIYEDELREIEREMLIPIDWSKHPRFEDVKFKKSK